MNAEELGKTEALEESPSSAKLSPMESIGAEIDDDAAAEETTAHDDRESSSESDSRDAADIESLESVADINGVADAVAAPAEAAEEEPGEDKAAAVTTEASQAESATAESQPSETEAEMAPTEPEAEPSADETPGDGETAAVADEADGDVGESVAEVKTPEAVPEKPDPPKYRRGQVFGGVITKTTPTAVFVDLGDGDEGVVPGRELELMTRKMLESLVVGANVDVYVVNPRNHRGEIVLSINHALEELDWRKAKKFAKTKDVYEALIGGYNKGGLIVRFGRLRGFVPQSQLAEERARGIKGETPEERYGPMVNQPIGVKVMEVDRGRNRLILSERAATREVRQQRKKALIEELRVGEIRKGIVASLENFGAFVDIGGAEGLVHLSELAWEHITHPRQAVNIGDEIEVEVISINPDAGRIGLSRRRVLSDPWDEVATSLRRGQLVRGRVTKLTKFGAFARLVDNDAVEGLIHISELAGERVSHPREVVKRGDELVLRIVKIDIKDRRLGLSLKSVNSTEYLDLDWEMALQDSASIPQEPAANETDAESESQAEE